MCSVPVCTLSKSKSSNLHILAVDAGVRLTGPGDCQLCENMRGPLSTERPSVCKGSSSESVTDVEHQGKALEMRGPQPLPPAILKATVV